MLAGFGIFTTPSCLLDVNYLLTFTVPFFFLKVFFFSCPPLSSVNSREKKYIKVQAFLIRGKSNVEASR